MLADVPTKLTNILRSVARSRSKCLCHRRLPKIKTNKAYSTEAAQPNTVPIENIRNFCIIAHIDHGKSTLADRILEITGVIIESKENKQVLDRLPVEKERGITVKAVSASLKYNYKNTEYVLNLIDTPGHVDFSNEVSRSLFACQGAVLLIDANQGVQAQTVANFYSAFTKELEIIPVLNKIDLPNADPESVEKELETLFGFKKSSVLRISAKTGLGVEDLLKTIIEKLPPPKVKIDAPFKALLIDSWFDHFRGAILFIYVVDGKVKIGDEVTTYKEKKTYTVKSTGKLTPEEVPVDVLHAGQVGVIGCNMRTPKAAIIGDTLYSAKSEIEPLESFSNTKAMVFAGLYPKDSSELDNLNSAVERLCLNDPSVTVTIENSPALGYGWRLGFLGLLHLDVFRQRLEQEFNADAILTAPSVTYKVKIKGEKKIKEYGGEIIDITNPLKYPTEPSAIEETYEPVVSATIITPIKYLNAITEECLDRRAVQDSTTPLDSNRIMMKLTMPLSEVIFDFHDTLKSLSSGYASFDYEEKGYVPAPLKKLTVTINWKEVDELTTIVHLERARQTATKIVTRLMEAIPRQQVEVAVRAAIDGDVLVRRNLKAYRKDVTAKVKAGDLLRKMKLLKQQAEGKKKMRTFANVQVERDIFINVLKEK